MKWVEALKIYNAGKSWCVPRKGTPEHAEVMKIVNRTKPAEVEKRNVERREKSMEQLKALDTRKKIEERREKDKAKDSSFKDIYIQFLKNVLNGEPAKHSNSEVKYSEDGEKYHMWRSKKSYPIVALKGISPFERVVPGGGITMELGYDTPTLGRANKEPDFPLTEIYFMIYSLDKRIGKMSPTNALKEGIRILEGANVEPPSKKEVRWGKEYKEGLDLAFQHMTEYTFDEIYDDKQPEWKRIDALKYRLRENGDPNNERILRYLKGKKVKGVSAKMKRDTLEDKLVLPVKGDEDLLASITYTGPFEVLLPTPNNIKARLELMEKAGLGPAK